MPTVPIPPVKIGERFGRWLVTDEPIKVGSRWRVPCRCDCGTKRHVDSKNLRKQSRSCGCRQREATTTHGGSQGRLYKSWHAMKRRCLIPSSRPYPDYGGRGIRVCQEWQESFRAFKDWAVANGYTESRIIDRIDNDGHYEPENCRWVTHAVSNLNTRRNRLLTALGETKPLVEWARDPRCRVTPETFRARLNRLGWDAERAITTPTRTPARGKGR